jgi:chromosome partitioning protein
MSSMMRTVAVLNQKGGVGKTTVTLGLASAAAAAGRRVLVVDADPQAASTWVLGHDPAELTVSVADLLDGDTSGAAVRAAVVTSAWSERVDLVPASSQLQRHERGSTKRLRRALERITERAGSEDGEPYDVVLIDCPPSLGTLTRSALTASRHALIVVEPSSLGLRGIGGVADAVDDVWDTTNPALELAGVVLNRVPAISSEAERRIDELVRIVGRSAIWKPAVPQRVVLNQAIGERRPIHDYGYRATDPIEAFDRLWSKLLTTVRRAGN